MLCLGLAWPFGAGCGGAPASGRFGRGLAKVDAPPDILTMEHDMFARLNRDRADGGRAALVYDEELAAVGRSHSADMRDHHFFAHESPTTGTVEDRLDAAGYLAIVGRENLAEAIDVPTAQAGLMKSPGHHANIMSTDITKIGIGIVRGGVKDAANFLFTQVFARPAEMVTPAALAASVGEKIEAARKSNGAPRIPHDGKFRDLAEAHVADLDDSVDNATTSRVGDLVMHDLSSSHSAAKGVMVLAAVVLDASMYEIPDRALSPEVTEFGVAAHAARDSHGRPAVKVLLLLAR